MLLSSPVELSQTSDLLPILAQGIRVNRSDRSEDFHFFAITATQ